MAKAVPRNKVSDFRGVGRLAADATVGLTNLVEALHHNISRAPAPLGRAPDVPMTGLAGFVYRSIRRGTRVAGGGIDLLLAAIAPLLANEPSSARREALLAALNGVLGDHLASSGNPLAIRMRLRPEGPARPRVVVMVHGLCFNDLQWRRNGHDHGVALALDSLEARPLTTVYAHYNTGQHIADNGRELAEALEGLTAAWPMPLEEIAIVAHSMGGLVTRSACIHGANRGHAWPRRLRDIVFLGTPHQGAPLERGGHWVDLLLGASPYTAAFARLGRLRSAGITDLRHGSILDGDGAASLPPGVECRAVAACLGRRPGSLKERLLGDGLVPVDSALGAHAGPGGEALFQPSHQYIAYGTNHLGLLDSKRVYRKLARWLL